MYKVYFKQAIELLKQNKFISTISIAGTALAIMMVMVLIVVDQVKNADIAPESKRSEFLQIDFRKIKKKKYNSMSAGPLLFDHVRMLKEKIKSADNITATDGIIMNYIGKTVRTKDSKLRISMDVRSSDANYWDFFSFKFLAGKPFTQADFNSGLKKVVLNESMAKEIFKKEEAIGQKIRIDVDEYTVIGVVKDVSKAFKNAYAQAWIPYTSVENFEERLNFQCFFLVNPSKVEDVKKEVRNIEKEWDQTNEDSNITFIGPFNNRESQLNVWEFESDKKITNRRIAFLFSILLLIPAINLSSISLSRVRRRMEEIGIRKSFGAKRHTILIQVLYENFITSVLGGIIGLVLSFFVVSYMKEWLLDATDTNGIPLNALISVPVVFAVLIVSFILNLLSSGIPAWRAANMNIVDSLNRKK